MFTRQALIEPNVRQALLKALAFIIAAALFMFCALSTVNSSRALADTTGTPESNRTGTTNFVTANPQNCPKYLTSVLASSDAVKARAQAEEAKVAPPPTSPAPNSTGGTRSY